MTVLGSGRRRALAGLGAIATGVLLAGCATSPPASTTGSAGSPGGSTTQVTVVAAENFWGSIARSLGGEHATVTSIITNPDADPHDYEPTPADGRTVASAQLDIRNGAGYDPWAENLIGADPNPRRTVLDVGDLVGVPDGGNPHQWYSPISVQKVIDQITADYKKIDPADSAYFDQQRQTYLTRTLATYHQLVSDIKAKYAGTPIGASESIVTPLAEGLGLKMLTPETFLDAISEGSDPTAADKTTIDDQIRAEQIKVYFYNTQNATPDVRAQVNEAKAAGIPVVTVTETLAPANVSFADWQDDQLQRTEQALAQATGK